MKCRKSKLKLMENNKKCGHEPSKERESKRKKNTLFGSSMDLGVIRIRCGCGGRGQQSP